MLWRIVILALVFLLLAPSLEQPPPVRVLASPQIAIYPAAIRLTVRVPHHADNRYLAIWDTAESQRSEQSLDGESADGVIVRDWTHLPPGEWDIWARVYGPGSRVRGSDRVTIRLLEPHE